MCTSSVRASAVVLGLLCCTVTGLLWHGTSRPVRAGAEEPDNSRINTLLKERLETLRELAALTAKLHDRGAASLKDLHAANEAVLREELEFATSQNARIDILERLVAEARDYEKRVAQSAKAGAVQPVLALEAKAQRLKTEIALERARQKKPGGDKK